MSTPSITPGNSLYRPPQWAGPAMVSVSVAPQSTSSSDASGNITTTTTGQTTYVFDAVLDLEHEQRLEKTHHPVQTGADISSHAYLMPARCVLYVGMSDAMAAYSSGATNGAATGTAIVNAWTGSPSKSVSAYLTMLNLQSARTPLTVTTRLRTYTNMVVTSISPREDSKTITGLRMRVEFEQIFTASTTSTPVSARSNDTQSTGLGAVNPSPVPTSTQSQFGVPPSTAPGQPVGTDQSSQNLLTYLQANPQGVDVPGAGSYSSTNFNNLSNLQAPQ